MTTENQGPTRGIDIVAPYYLSQFRNQAGSTRRSPKQPDQPACSIDAPPDTDTDQAVELRDETFLQEKSPYGLLAASSLTGQSDFSPEPADLDGDDAEPMGTPRVVVFADHLNNWRDHLKRFARETAWFNGATSLICFDQEEVHVWEYHANRDDVTPLGEAIDGAWKELFSPAQSGDTTESPPAMEGLERMFREQVRKLTQRCHTLIIHVDSSRLSDAAALLNDQAQTVVLCGPTPEQTIDGYRALKRLHSLVGATLDASIYVCDCQEESLARNVFEKLLNTSQRYLNYQPQWAGWEQPFDEVTEHHLLSVDLDENLLSVLIDCLQQTPAAEELTWTVAETDTTRTDQTTPEQEDDQNEAIYHVSESWQSAVEDPDQAQPELPQAQLPDTVAVCPGPGAITQLTEQTRRQLLRPRPVPPPVLEPIALKQMPTNDQAFADTLSAQAHLWTHDIDDIEELYIPLPDRFRTGTRLLSDANGRVFILQAALNDNESLLSKALAVKSWYAENRSLLSLASRRELQPPAQCELILAVSGDESAGTDASAGAGNGLEHCRRCTVQFLQVGVSPYMIVRPA